MPQTAWLAPGTITSTTASSVSWANPTNAAASDNTYTTATVTGWLLAGPELLCSNFNFNLPSNATVSYVEISVEGSYTLSGGATTADYEGTGLAMYKVISTRTATSGWPLLSSISGATEAVRTTSALSTGAISTNGTALNTWTVSEWNASTCGISVPSLGTTSNATTGGTVVTSIDQVLVRLTYDLASNHTGKTFSLLGYGGF
jgi:hypothetical protein